jgi:CHAT domain-containing protein/Flp pilus assembly protein TadD
MRLSPTLMLSYICLLFVSASSIVITSSHTVAQTHSTYSTDHLIELKAVEHFDQQVAVLSQQGKFEQAIPLAVKALTIRKRILNQNDSEIDRRQQRLAWLYERSGRIVELELFYQEILAVRKRTLGESHPKVIMSLRELAQLYQRQRRFAEAESFYKKVLELRRQTLGENHLDVASGLIDLGNLYYEQGRFEEVELLYKSALELRKRQLGEHHLDVAHSFDELARLYGYQQRYSEQEAILKQALELRKHHPSDTFLAANLERLALLYSQQGRYTEAEFFYKQALSLNDLDSIPMVIQRMQGLANLYQQQGRYAEAESLIKQELKLREDRLEEDHVATVLRILANLYRQQGRYVEAESLFKKLLSLSELKFNKNNPNEIANAYVVSSLTDLATVYDAQGRYVEAESLFKRALTVSQQIKPDRYFSNARIQMSLAFLYQKQERYAEVEFSYKQVLELRKHGMGENHPMGITALDKLANLYEIQGRYTEAESIYREVLALRRRRLGENNRFVTDSLNDLARLHQRQGKSAEAIVFLSQGLKIQEEILDVNFSSGAEDQKQAYFETITDITNATIALDLQSAHQNSSFSRLAATTILRRKGRILDILTNQLQRLRQNLTPTDQNKLDQLAVIHTQLAKLFYGGLGNLTPEQYQSRIDQQRLQATQLEVELSSRSAEFRNATQPIELAAIQAKIPEKAVLVEFIRYLPMDLKQPSNRDGKPHYAAYIIFQHGEVQSIDLGDAAVIDQLVTKFRRQLQNADSDIKPIARKLDILLMEPVRRKIGPQAMPMLISPDSQLNLIPFAALVDEKDRYLIETSEISYLTSGRDLLRLRREHNAQPAIILANPNYESAMDSPHVLAQTRTPLNLRSVDLQVLSFSSLPGTSDEAEVIAAKLPGSILWTGSRATETALKQVQSPLILHIATHGFFLPNVPQAIPSQNLAFNQMPHHRSENPLLRSGLALAGANLRKGGDANSDGIFTALEATNLDLRNTQLVVLSACETGLGDVSNGEGVYGLRRAFALAGAETQMISLWRVDDEGTRYLMEDYYNQLHAGKSRSEALLQTQREFLKLSQYQHPHYWASFILSGNWTALP